MELVTQFGAQKYVNKNFAYGDNEALFKKNLKFMPNDWIWRTKKINYTVNSQFYRTKEWKDIDWNNSYIMFGCSLVFGIGLDDNEICSTHLSKLLGYPVINLGMPGGSPYVCWINSTRIRKNNITPKGIIYLWPTITRTSRFVDEDALMNYGTSWNEDYIFRDWADDTFHCIQHFKGILDSIELYWQCPIYHFHHFTSTCSLIPRLKFLDIPYTFNEDHARDVAKKNAHPGPKTNLYWAQKINDHICRNN